LDAIAVTAKVRFDDRRPPPKFKVPPVILRPGVHQHQQQEWRTGGDGGGWKRQPPRSGATMPRDNVSPPPSPLPGCVAAFETARRRGHPSTTATPRDFPEKGAVSLMPLHRIALGEGHYSGEGKPVTSAPTPAIDPTLVGTGGGAMYSTDPRCTVAFRVTSSPRA